MGDREAVWGIAIMLLAAATPFDPAGGERTPGPEGAAPGREAGRAVVNEFLPRPVSDWNGDGLATADDEFIELFNPDPGAPADLSGLLLDDAVDGTSPFAFPDGTVVPPLGFLVLFGNLTGIGLNDGGDSVRLVNSSGFELDNLTFGAASLDRSFGRHPDGSGGLRELTFPSPGLPNIIDEPPRVRWMLHSPEHPPAGRNVTVTASVEDDIGVSEVRLDHEVNGTGRPSLRMVKSDGNYTATVPGQPEGTRVNYTCSATDSRGQVSAPLPVQYFTFTAPVPLWMVISASFNSTDYPPAGAITITGRASLDTGWPAVGAYITAALWVGTVMATAFSDEAGNFSLHFHAPSEDGNYTVTLWARKGELQTGLSLELWVRSTARIPPVISSAERTPFNVSSGEDVLISAVVTDDIEVRQVNLYYRVLPSGFVRLQMGRGTAGRFLADIPAQSPGREVEYYIEASDGSLLSYYPPGAPGGVLRYVVLDASTRTSIGITASLNATECFINRSLLASGLIRNESGSPVAGARVVLSVQGLPAPSGPEALTDSNGVFRMEFCSPLSPGHYTIVLACAQGLLANSTSVKLSVKDSLRVTLRLSRSSMPPSSKFSASGRVLRSDGSGAAGAVVTAALSRGPDTQNATAGPDGSFTLILQAPARTGKVGLVVTARFQGLNATEAAELLVLEARSDPLPALPALAVLAALSAAMVATRMRR